MFCVNCVYDFLFDLVLCLVISDGQIYERAKSAYDALSSCLGEQNYLFENR